MSDKKLKSLDVEAAPEKPADKSEEKTRVVYTHGKKFIRPASEKLEDFLKKQFPAEYK